MDDIALDYTAANQWLKSKGITPNKVGWSFYLSLSTVNAEHWLYKRNRLQPEDLQLELKLQCYGSWVVQLERHDRLFIAQWRQDNRFEIESQQLKYRRLIQWPELKSLDDFPKLVPEIEKALGVKFTGHVNVGADCDDLQSHLNLNSTLAKWLVDCCKSLGTNRSED